MEFNKFESGYKNLLTKAIALGLPKDNRTGIQAFTLFNENLTIDLKLGFPILTSKKIFFDKALAEYNWMMQGMTRLTYLHRHGVKWWDEFADKDGYLGKTYGYQIRSFNGEIDQLHYISQEIKSNSRRAHLTLWNPSDLGEVQLPPCYTGFTFMRVNDKLNMTMQLRSSDLFLGLPYDICVASLMLTDIAGFNDLTPNHLGIQITDAHIYGNHLDQVHEYLERPTHPLPSLHKNGEGEYILNNYKHDELIKAKLNN